MKNKTSTLCKAASVASIVVMIILWIITDGFVNQLKIAAAGLLLGLLFATISVIIDMIEKTKT